MVEKSEVLEKHRMNKGKIEIMGKVPVETQEQLSTYYTPGVALVCNEIRAHPEGVYEYTNKANTLAIVTDGTRILGLGDIGPEAGMPVMEGKSLLFKKYGGVDAVPLCIRKSSEEEILTFLKQIEPTFGAINIEDIESPKSLRIVRRASELLQIPVFHDDQQGTAVVVLAALINALKLAGKGKEAKIVLMGSGSAGIGIANLLHFAGFKRLYVLDSEGAIYRGRAQHMNEFKEEIALKSNPENAQGGLDGLIGGADVFIGASGIPNSFKKEFIGRMAGKPILFALTNPAPEIDYEEAKSAGAFIIATGRSDKPNQINNSLSFPGIVRGLLEVRATRATEEMLFGAAKVIAKSANKNLSPDCIMPLMSDRRAFLKVTQLVAAEIGATAIKLNLARTPKSAEEIKANTKALVQRYAKMERKLFGKTPT